MAFKAKKFSTLLGLQGFSDEILTTHFGLYEGYVKNTNTLLELLDKKEPGTVEYSELQRRFGWEWNGMRLHELYFSNLTKTPKSLSEGNKIKKAIKKIYGSFENWRKNFIAVGTMRGIGWVLLYYDPATKELFNIWINEHDTGHLSGATPLLVMDVFEHAYMHDYGTARADYIEAFFKAIDWGKVVERFDKAK